MLYQREENVSQRLFDETPYAAAVCCENGAVKVGDAWRAMTMEGAYCDAGNTARTIAVVMFPDTEAVRDAALGVVTRSDDWGAESWESAAKLAEQAGYFGLADKCRSIAAEMRTQEAEK